MNRYDRPAGVEGECEPGSHGRVLRNLLGIKRKSEMDHVELEALITAQETYYRERFDESTRVTADFIKDMHRDWLGGIYAWAGKYRTVDLEKDGFVWPPAYLVTDNMRHFEETSLAKCTPCLPGDLHSVYLHCGSALRASPHSSV